MWIPSGIVVVLVLIMFFPLLLFKRTRDRLYVAFDKVVTIITSKRFLTLLVATIAEWKGVHFSALWFTLAGAFIGIDYLKHEGVLSGLGYRLKNSIPGQVSDKATQGSEKQ